ncbi:MAG: alpha/beta hydrolase family protein [Chloroflexota bacterium]
MSVSGEVEFGAGLHGIVQGDGRRGVAVISHGAGRGMDAPLLERTAERLAELGLASLRWNFGYLGKRPAPSAGGKREVEELRQAIALMAEYGRPILIGKSFGARVSSYVAAGRDDLAGLVFYGLPLQGLGRNARPRDWSHLEHIAAPMLFITGNHDALCPLERLAEVQRPIAPACTSVVVQGDHSYKPRGEAEALEHCLMWVRELISAP